MGGVCGRVVVMIGFGAYSAFVSYAVGVIMRTVNAILRTVNAIRTYWALILRY